MRKNKKDALESKMYGICIFFLFKKTKSLFLQEVFRPRVEKQSKKTPFSFLKKKSLLDVKKKQNGSTDLNC